MIDLTDIEIPLPHKPFGNERIKRLDESTIEVSKQYSKQVRLIDGCRPIDVTSLDKGTKIAIRCCPLKPLQGHNVFGTNDVRLICYTLICAVLDKLNIAYTDKDRAAWLAGEYEIKALDINYRFQLPTNISEMKLCSYLHQNMGLAFRTEWFRLGIGTRMGAPRSNAAWTFYDKKQELWDKRTNGMKDLRAVVGDKADEIFGLLCETAATTIRAELKLNHTYLQSHSLNRGSAWTLRLVQDVYFSEMAKLRFNSHKPLDQLREQIAGVTNRTLRQTLEMWSAGLDLPALFTETTLGSHRKQIKAETGIDIILDRPTFEPLPLTDIFARDKAVRPFPRWVREHRAAGFNSPDPVEVDRRTASKHRGVRAHRTSQERGEKRRASTLSAGSADRVKGRTDRKPKLRPSRWADLNDE